MKNLIKTTLVVGLIISGVFYSCQKDGMSDMNYGDDQLIQAIQNATNKVTIASDELPTASKSTISSDYSDSYTNQAMMAPQLGYEVELRKGRGDMLGELSTTYFDLNGRELIPGMGKEGKHGIGGRHGDRPEGGKERAKCFDFVLPATFTMPDGTEITVEDESGWEAIKNWFEANPDSKERPDVQFPVDLIFEDGTTLTVSSEEEIVTILEDCKEDSLEKGKCFQFVLPVTLIMPDGTEITVEDETGWESVKEWHEANPDIKERPDILFPVDIILVDGTTSTINNEDELAAIHETCHGDKMDKKRCFEFVLPVTFTMPDGTEILVEDEAGWEAIKEWYDANQDSQEKPVPQYPVQIVFPDESVVTINSDEEMDATKEACKDNGRH